MNNRERFLKTMRFETVDHPPLAYIGNPWPATRLRWEQEGLPEGITLEEYFAIEPLLRAHVNLDTLLCPPFPERIVEETDEYVIKYDKHGVKVRNFKDDSSMPEHLEYPIKDLDDIDWLFERLDWNTPERIDPNWLEQARADQAEGKLVFVNGGMYFAFLNEHMGTDKLMFAYFENPERIHAVNDRLCTLCENVLREVTPRFQIDTVGFHEDMAFKNGSFISPDMFREFMTPYYQRIQALAGPAGIDLRFMDSDGNIKELIPLWLEQGINIMTPLEVAAGMDVVELRKEYGRDLKLMGGFDKRILASTKPAIKAELERLRPVIEGGGYIPGCDHLVPPDVSLENYSYLIELLKRMYGM